MTFVKTATQFQLILFQVKKENSSADTIIVMKNGSTFPIRRIHFQKVVIKRENILRYISQRYDGSTVNNFINTDVVKKTYTQNAAENTEGREQTLTDGNNGQKST